MTTAERLRAEGHAQGRAEGHAQGRAEGHAEGRAEGAAWVLLELLVAKFGTLSAETVHRVRSADTDELETWVLRVLTASTVDEVFAPD